MAIPKGSIPFLCGAALLAAAAAPAAAQTETIRPLTWGPTPYLGSASGEILPENADLWVFEAYTGGMLSITLPGHSSFALDAPLLQLRGQDGLSVLSEAAGRVLNVSLAAPGLYHAAVLSQGQGGLYAVEVFGGWETLDDGFPHGDGDAEIGPVRTRAETVPEPAPLALVLAALPLLLLAARRRQRRATA